MKVQGVAFGGRMNGFYSLCTVFLGSATTVLLAYVNRTGCIRVCQLEVDMIPKRDLSARFRAGPTVSGTHSPVTWFERHSVLPYVAALTAKGEIIIMYKPEV